MSERPVADLDNVGDDSSDTASNDATDGDQQQQASTGSSGSQSQSTSGRDEELMPDLAANAEGGATESNPN